MEKIRKAKLSFANMIGYGVGAIGLDLSYGMFYSFLSHYLVTTLGLKEGFLLLLTPLARIWDGINDPMMGTIVDNTRTKHGKYRPWIVIGAVCNAVVLFLLFSRFGLSGTPLYIYVAVMYVLWGMTNTLADIPYWSMIPSFTSEEKERNLVSTVARTFSGLGQGIIMVLTPIILPRLSGGIDTDADGYSAAGFSRWAGICGILLILFAVICVLVTKERNVVYGEKKKFSFKQIFAVIKNNDQLVVFMVFAMLSNAGWYLTSGTAYTYFTMVVGDGEKQSLFGMIGAVGSVVGLVVIPVLSKLGLNKRTIYTFSLCTTITGYVLMFVFGPVLKITIALDICYILASIGIASMFVSQTVFLADIVDYGEYKNGERNESITFSMKGFLQKLAYTIQTVIYYGGLALVRYSAQINECKAKGVDPTVNSQTQMAIGIIAFAVPPVLILLSLIVFRRKFKIYGELSDKIHYFITEKRASEFQEELK